LSHAWQSGALQPPPDPPLDELLNGLASGFVRLDSRWCIADCNAAAERLFNCSREDLLGCRYCDLAGLGQDTAFAALVQKVAATRIPEQAEVQFRDGGRPRLLAMRAFPLGAGIGAIWNDITAARAAERRLALSESRYHEVAGGMPAAAWMSRADGKLVFVNQAMVEAFGRSRRQLLGHGWMDSIDPEDRPGLIAAREQARANHSSAHYQGRFRRPDGSLRIIQLYGRPRFDALGTFRGHVGIATDVTEAREAEQRQILLINELNHRVKNTLATVQALVRQTLREHDTASDVEQAVTERLLALSTAHDVLNRETWKGADLADLLNDLLRPYDAPGRIVTGGPEAWISPKTTIALAMAVHELATNATKYGALSTPRGRVELYWTPEGATVALEWREFGGPAVAKPERSGFGSLLLGRMLERELGAAADIVYAAEGLTCRLRAPVADREG
jgi:PAS domain S-box-containing protein